MDEIDAATTRLRVAIDDLNDAAHLAVGRELALAREPVDLGELARAVAREFALQRAVAVEAPDAPLLVTGDRARLDRALQNLIGNAIKYSPPAAAVVVTVTRSVAAGVIAVHDRGAGIPAAALPHIFERYYRAATAHGIAGSGLGLTGAKAIVERHGGTITAESAENTGTTVTVTLPLAPDAANAIAGA
jgi:signal transduction histidine kinase